MRELNSEVLEKFEVFDVEIKHYQIVLGRKWRAGEQWRKCGSVEKVWQRGKVCSCVFPRDGHKPSLD